MGEDIGALEGLVAESEDIIDDENGGGGVGWAGGVYEADGVSSDGKSRRLGTLEGRRTNSISSHHSDQYIFP